MSFCEFKSKNNNIDKFAEYMETKKNYKSFVDCSFLSLFFCCSHDILADPFFGLLQVYFFSNGEKKANKLIVPAHLKAAATWD